MADVSEVESESVAWQEFSDEEIWMMDVARRLKGSDEDMYYERAS